jgi:hypothetical protein
MKTIICNESEHKLKESITIYKVVQIWPGLFVCKQVTVCPGPIWTTLYFKYSMTLIFFWRE